MSSKLIEKKAEWADLTMAIQVRQNEIQQLLKARQKVEKEIMELMKQENRKKEEKKNGKQVRANS